MTRDLLQTERDEVLSTTADDIRNSGSMIREIISKQVFCVYGNETVIENQKELFGKIVRLNI
jgi:Zn-dependent M16 (insulinase) family peptidase